MILNVQSQYLIEYKKKYKVLLNTIKYGKKRISLHSFVSRLVKCINLFILKLCFMKKISVTSDKNK